MPQHCHGLHASSMLQTGLARQQCDFIVPLWHDGSEGPSLLGFEQRYLIICFHSEIADKDFYLPQARTHDLAQYYMAVE